MRRILIALSVWLLVALPALAATTWTRVATPTSYRAFRATCTTGTEAAPAATTDGIGLSGITGLTVNITAEADAGALGAGYLYAYTLSPTTGVWSRAPDLDLTISAGNLSQTFTGLRVTVPAGRLAYVPQGVGVPVTVELIGM